jgi:ubiquinone/menaquinone biosynthesis C-methylase UbiE
MVNNTDSLIRQHYQQQAEKDGASPLSTIGEIVVREKEVELIKNFLVMVQRKTAATSLRILDVGCGNGYTLDALRKVDPSFCLYGLEFTEELLSIALSRNLKEVVLEPGDIRRTHYDDAYFDVVYTERCLINIIDVEEQKKAIREISRILKTSGYYLMIEGFTDGLVNNNQARREMGLEDINPAFHNLYFDKKTIFSEISDIFKVVDPKEIDNASDTYLLQSNFLSSHYFVARILQPLMTKGEWIRNTEFVKFFSFLPPIGNYAPIQAYILKKVTEN